ncbi:MAG: NAD(P)-binding protein [Candidatus Diapherotrites archaeon]|nr:NAD(P)-binding protein [Candidatus Diapherotrites archaeon]
MRADVVGAGPAGLYTAYRLADAGISVSVYDQATRVGNKVCSGLLSSNTVKRFGLKRVARHSVDGARIHAGSEQILVRRRNVAYVFDRAELDGYLYDLALSSGANVFLGKRIGRVPKGDIIVGADGAGSFIRSACFKSNVRTVLGAIAYVRGTFDRYVDVYLDPKLAPEFFAWLIPRGEDEAEIGLALPPRMSASLLPRLSAFARKLGFNSYVLQGVRPIVVSPPLLRVVRGNCAIVGDAAAHVKATTGGGISYGLRAADVLSTAIVHGGLDQYQRWHRSWALPRLYVHYAARKWLNHVDAEHVLRVLRERGFEYSLSKSGDMDDPLFLFSPRYLGLISQIVSPFAYIRHKSPQNHLL